MARPPDLGFYPLRPAAFVSRPNRFVILASHKGRQVRAACRDPGRLKELLRPGARLLLDGSKDPNRRTAFTTILVRHYGRWVSMVPSFANALFEVALDRGAPGLPMGRVVRREVAVGRSRIDFEIEGPLGRTLVEVKSATLVVDGRAFFPDAPTSRGRRHLQELIAHRQKGGLSMVVFVVQRDDASSLRPHTGHDPAFAETLFEARRAGVELAAFTCKVGRNGITLDRPIPVVL